jgi:hypothetical protein
VIIPGLKTALNPLASPSGLTPGVRAIGVATPSSASGGASRKRGRTPGTPVPMADGDDGGGEAEEQRHPVRSIAEPAPIVRELCVPQPAATDAMPFQKRLRINGRQ